MTKKKPELDEFEKKYWKESLADLRQAETAAQAATQRHNAAQVKFQGFAQMIQDKYGIPNDTEISPEGEIIEKTEANML